MSTTLLLSTESYPWDLAKEQTFLEPELPRLAQRFDRVVVAPQQLGGIRLPVPAGWEVDESYARSAARMTFIDLLAHAGASSLVAEDLLRRGSDAGTRAGLKRLVAFAGRAHHAARWARAFASRDASVRKVFYTYWWGATTTGFGLARAREGSLRVVSRTHGFDLYEDRHSPPYLPCRERSVRVIDGLFPDSETGRAYLLQRFGRSLPRCETARLGLLDPEVTCSPSSDGVLRIASCSLQVPVKRLRLLIAGLGQVARNSPGLRLEWTHFGTGPLQAENERLAGELPSNVNWRFAGYSTQAALFDWYARTPVDVFVNVSASEGTPVSIMEAIACGIPVLATAVGGNPEIATAANGLQLPASPTKEDLAAALILFLPGEHSASWRVGSKALWRARYDAEANFSAFAETLASI